jgi:phosphate transport system permease protein
MQSTVPRSAASRVIARTPPAIYRWLGDRIFATFIVFFGVCILVLAVLTAWVLGSDAWLPIRTFGFFGFLTGTTWDPVAQVFGAWPFILGTLITSICALAISFLPAIGVAIFTAEYAPRWLANIINTVVDLLAAIPSVVIGIWGIFVFSPWMRDTFYMPIFLWASQNAQGALRFLGAPTGYNIVTATIVLSFMIVPYTVALSRDAIRMVPREQREAMFALGATRWEVMRQAVLPYARGGIAAGVMLSVGRAIGETMAVAMLIGNSNNLPYTLFGPAATMPSVIVNEFREAVGRLYSLSLIAVGFYLLLISLIVNLAAAMIRRRLAVEGSRGI